MVAGADKTLLIGALGQLALHGKADRGAQLGDERVSSPFVASALRVRQRLCRSQGRRRRVRVPGNVRVLIDIQGDSRTFIRACSTKVRGPGCGRGLSRDREGV